MMSQIEIEQQIRMLWHELKCCKQETCCGTSSSLTNQNNKVVNVSLTSTTPGTTLEQIVNTINTTYGFTVPEDVNVVFTLTLEDESLVQFLFSPGKGSYGFGQLQVVSAGDFVQILVPPVTGGAVSQLEKIIEGGTEGWRLLGRDPSQYTGTGLEAIDFSYQEPGGYGGASGISSFAEGAGNSASGDYSHAEGSFNQAIGFNAHAEGEATIASGDDSHAEGNDTDATEFGAHAEGVQSLASGQASHAEGIQTIASSSGSHAEGHLTTASNSYSHAEGHQTTASGPHSHTEGQNTTANAIAAHAEGSGSFAGGVNSHAEGTNTLTTGTSSHAEGNLANAAGDASHAEGTSTTATGDNSHAEGFNCAASGDNSHAEGDTSGASGINSHAEGKSNAGGAEAHAEGNSCSAQGARAHAEGMGTIASGANSHSEGNLTTAAAVSSHAGGEGNFSNCFCETVIGLNSMVIGGNATAYAAIDPAFRVGIGADGVNKRDGFRVYKNGAQYMFPTTTGAVTNGANGFMIFNDTTKKLAIHNGTAWIDVPTIGTTAPASAVAAGTPGEIRITATFIYVCIAANTWVRGVVATF